MIIELTEEQKQQKRIVLDAFLVAGDEVIVLRSKHGDTSYDHLPPDGTRAFVVGHSTYFRHVDRATRMGRKPGVYRGWGASICQFEENGKKVFRHLCPHSLIFADTTIDPQATRREGTYTWEMCHDGVYIGGLPELPFYEGDLVSVDATLLSIFPDGEARIENIEYAWMADASDKPLEDRLIYRLMPVSGGFTTNAAGRHLQLKERGLFYHYEQTPDLIDQFPYKDLFEKARFFMAVDKAVQMKNEKAGNYGFTVEEAEEMLRAGKGAFISSHIFTRPNTWAQRGRPTNEMGPVWLYDIPEYPELAAQCRELTLKAFQEPTDYRYNNEREPLNEEI